ncbi:MAG: transposase family protein [Nocardia sp.]|uniref:hypothetical protein n=1 Tax=Nocardia sp. TaxID=1821 RepID=UPI00260627E8|nr:hypothetical protein [Nocardia sp.]MCU1648037.1 transposase family protein [Nocardia sp.]
MATWTASGPGIVWPSATASRKSCPGRAWRADLLPVRRLPNRTRCASSTGPAGTPASRRPTVPVRSGLTDTPLAGGGSAQYLEVRHRGHATVEDHIRCGKTTGFGRFPSRHFEVNAAWLQLSPTVIDLLAWTRALLLDGELATSDPNPQVVVRSGC